MPIRTEVTHAYILVVLEIPLPGPGAGIGVLSIRQDAIELHIDRFGGAPWVALYIYFVRKPRGVDCTLDAVRSEIDHPADVAKLDLGGCAVMHLGVDPVIRLQVGRRWRPVLGRGLKSGCPAPEILRLGEDGRGCLDCNTIGFGHGEIDLVPGFVEALHPVVPVIDAQVHPRRRFGEGAHVLEPVVYSEWDDLV